MPVVMNRSTTLIIVLLLLGAAAGAFACQPVPDIHDSIVPYPERKEIPPPMRVEDLPPPFACPIEQGDCHD